jgi:multidrug efflux system outer membrane protein
LRRAGLLQYGLVLPCMMPLAGCELAPDYEKPSIEQPVAFNETPGWTLARPSDDHLRGKWWSIFADADLDMIEDQVTTANQDLRAAVARYDEVRALARSARSALYPTLDAGASTSKGQLSKAISNPLPQRQTADDGLSLDLSWEIDLWGKVRDTAHSAGNRAEASGYDLAAAELSINAEAAVDYFMLRGLDAQQVVLDQTVAAYGTALQLTQDRFNAGYAAEPDVQEAQTLLQLAKTKAAETVLNRARLEHAIAILVGKPPAIFTLAPKPLSAVPPKVAGILPGDLLERRPDVAAAERRVSAANYDIGVARAAFYPDFNLSSMIGSEASAPNALFTSPAGVWAAGASGVLNLFDGGRRRAASAQAHAAFDEAAANYRETVLRAYGEVEDNLAALRQLALENQSQQAAVQSSAGARQQSERQYGSGYVAYFDVVTAQNIELSARLDAEDIRSRRMVADVLLIKALGGNWTPSSVEAGNSSVAGHRPL